MKLRKIFLTFLKCSIYLHLRNKHKHCCSAHFVYAQIGIFSHIVLSLVSFHIKSSRFLHFNIRKNKKCAAVFSTSHIIMATKQVYLYDQPRVKFLFTSLILSITKKIIHSNIYIIIQQFVLIDVRVSKINISCNNWAHVWVHDHTTSKACVDV